MERDTRDLFPDRARSENLPHAPGERWDRLDRGKYWVSTLGRVYAESSLRASGAGGHSGGLMTAHDNGAGYAFLTLTFTDGQKCGRTVHSLVMDVHGPQKPSDDAIINHINRDKTDNRLENLEWVSELENRLHTAVMEYVDQHGLSAFLDRICEWL